MRIAIITTSGRDLLKDWRPREPGLGTAIVALLEGFQSFPEHEIHVLMPVRKNVLPSRKEGNVIYHEVETPMWGMLKSFYLGSTHALRRKIRNIQPDLVHGQGTERECAMGAIFSCLPNVVTIHGNMRALARLHRNRFPEHGWWTALLEDFALKRTDGVFCNSKHTSVQVASIVKKSWRVPNAVRGEFFRPVSKRGKNPIPVLLNVGVVDPNKRQLEILATAQRLFNQGLRFRLRFFGSCGVGEYADEFRRQLAKSREFAEYCGTLGPAELTEAFDAADALIHSPMEEAFGLVVAEGMARGLKFFGSRTGGIIDITEGVEDAELTGPDDWADLEDRISRWIQNGFPRSIDGPTVMRSRYTPVAVAQRHIEIYEEVLRGRNQARS